MEFPQGGAPPLPDPAAAGGSAAAGEEARPGSAGRAGPSIPARRGQILLEVHDLSLSPAARIQAERYRCTCGSDLSIAVCTCGGSPGSLEMKRHLQSLAQGNLTPAEIERAVVEKYGPAVLL